MKKFAVMILLVFLVLVSVFYFAPSLFFDEPLRAEISLKPDDQDLVDLGKLVYKNNVRHAMVLILRVKSNGDNQTPTDTCRHHRMMKVVTHGITQMIIFS